MIIMIVLLLSRDSDRTGKTQVPMKLTKTQDHEQYTTIVEKANLRQHMLFFQHDRNQ